MTYSASNPPSGSYLQSVRNIQIVLIAKALNKNGQEINTSVVLPDNGNYALENDDGVLKVIPAASASQDILPAGSYTQTCQDVRVLLQCDARKVDGTYAKAVIDVTTLTQPDIENCDGILLDHSAIDDGLGDVQGLMPQYAGKIAGREDDIKAYMAGTYTPADLAAIPATANAASADSASLPVSPCMKSCIVLVVDIVISLLSYRAFTRAQLEAIAADEGVLQALNGSDVQSAAQSLARVIHNSGSALDFAQAVTSMISAVVSMSLVKAIVKAAEDQLSWLDMVKFSTVMMAQAVALFSPAGEAVIAAKAVLLFVDLEGLAEDAASVVDTCG